MRNVLSICIPTFNRGEYIGETLESIINQIEAGVEVVIVDGGSTDNTESVVADYQKICPEIHYFKSKYVKKYPSNEGFDRDCNYAVELASGEYCWLMTDDDLIMSGAIKRILQEVDKNYVLIIANTEIRNKDLSKLLTAKRPDISHDLVYTPEEFEQFAKLVFNHLTYLGAVIIKKSFWMNVNREKYFGTGFIHIGVIFDTPIKGKILVTSNPLITIRWGNAMWADGSSRAFQLWMFTWPELVWSFSTISDESKRSVCLKDPWKKLEKLLSFRVGGYYSKVEYKLFLKERLKSRKDKILSIIIAVIPISLLHIPLYIKKAYRYFMDGMAKRYSV